MLLPLPTPAIGGWVVPPAIILNISIMANVNQENTVFKTLVAINCNEHTERKGNLTYLSWAWAWKMVKTYFPDSTYTIYESPDGWNYFTDGKTCWVKTGVTIEGLEHIEYLPVMDIHNQSIPLEAVTSFDVNRTIQRSLTKACARHGLGLYIYAGEDLPETPDVNNAGPQQQFVSRNEPRPSTSDQSSWRQSRRQYFQQ